MFGESDGKFDAGDYILFFAQSMFNAAKNIFEYEHNLYADQNFYFITISDVAGKRVPTTENLGVVAPVINEFNDYSFHEVDKRE